MDSKSDGKANLFLVMRLETTSCRLTADEQKVIDFITQSPHATIDACREQLSYPIAKLNTLLTMLSVKSIIKEVNGKYYLT